MEIHFEIENRCMLLCRHCSSNAQINGGRMQYSVENIISLLKKTSSNGVIFFTGGEPLLCEDFLDILYQIKRELPDTILGMFTTGIVGNKGQILSVSKHYAEKLYKAGMRICYLSIYSDRAVEHDWMTGQDGSYSLTYISAQILIQIGIEVRFNLVVTKRNIDSISKIIEMVERWGGTELRLLKLVKHGRAIQSWQEIGVEESKYRDVVKKVFAKEWRIKITASSCSDIVPCRPFPNARGCQAGKELFYVTFEGEIFPCASVKRNNAFKLGNVKEGVIDSALLVEDISSNNVRLCSIE